MDNTSALDEAAVARAHYEAFNRRDLEQAAGLVAEDVTWADMATNDTYSGPEGYRQYLQNWLTAMPDVQMAPGNVSGGPGWAVAEWTCTGTNTGPFLGATGHMAPEGKQLHLRGCDVFQIHQGKIKRCHAYFDMATVMDQLALKTGGAPVDSTGVG